MQSIATHGQTESMASRIATPWPRGLRRVDSTALGTWALAGALTLYLGIDGAGYDIVVSSQVGVVVWWVVLVASAWGVLPAARLRRAAWAALALLACFVAWTALATTWSLSSERSLQELSRVACYLGVLLLAIAIHRDRDRAIRHTVNAVGAAVTVIALLALISRLAPGSFPASHVTASFLGGAQGRLSWPLNYWNGLGALIALGLPLLLSTATSARTLAAQAAAAGSLPLLALCGYLTFSRGGAAASAIAVLAFLALAPNRIPKLATTLLAAAGSAVLIVGAVHRSAIVRGLYGHAATVEGRQLLVAIVFVCGAVAIAQVGIGLAGRHGTPPRLLRVSPGRARLLLAGAVAFALVAAVGVRAPSRLSNAWNDFKHPNTSSLSNLPARFGSVSGTGRYEYWKVGVHATSSGHLLGGWGPGTFQLVWLPRASVGGYVTNAHSLYVETLTEVGLTGLALLMGFLLLVLVAAVGAVVGGRHEGRTGAAGTTAALLAFMVSALVEWVWQLPVLPAIFLLLAAAVLAPSKRTAAVGRRGRFLLRTGFVVAALGCLAAIGIPLATTSAVRKSQAAVDAGNISLALADARSAVRLQPAASSAQLQEALVLELQHDFPAALAAARNATRDEPQNWSDWLVLSRLDAETGHARASVAAYRRARSLNPLSPLFHA